MNNYRNESIVVFRKYVRYLSSFLFVLLCWKENYISNKYIVNMIGNKKADENRNMHASEVDVGRNDFNLYLPDLFMNQECHTKVIRTWNYFHYYGM